MNDVHDEDPALPEFVEEEGQNGLTQYNAFEDPNSVFYGIENFRPTGARPIPALRCARIKTDGTQCKKWAVRGTGLNGTQAVCNTHGGQLPRVKAVADKIVDAARLQLLSSAPDAIQTIMSLMMNSKTPDNVKLAAAKDVLDRIGVKGIQEVQVEITNTIPASEKILQRLADMRRDSQPELEDLGEVVDEDTEPESEQ